MQTRSLRDNKALDESFTSDADMKNFVKQAILKKVKPKGSSNNLHEFSDMTLK